MFLPFFLYSVLGTVSPYYDWVTSLRLVKNQCAIFVKDLPEQQKTIIKILNDSKVSKFKADSKTVSPFSCESPSVPKFSTSSSAISKQLSDIESILLALDPSAIAKDLLTTNFEAGLLIGAEIFRKYGFRGFELIQGTKNEYILSILDQLEISWLGICGFIPIRRRLNSMNSFATTIQARMGLVMIVNIAINKETYPLTLGINSKDVWVLKDQAKESLLRNMRGLAHTISASGSLRTINYQAALVEFDEEFRFISDAGVTIIEGFNQAVRPGSKGSLGLSREGVNYVGGMLRNFIIAPDFASPKSLYMLDNEGFLTVRDLSVPATITFNLPEDDPRLLRYKFVPSRVDQLWIAELEFLVNGEPQGIIKVMFEPSNSFSVIRPSLIEKFIPRQEKKETYFPLRRMRIGFRLDDGFDIDFEFGEDQRVFALKKDRLPDTLDLILGLNFMSLVEIMFDSNHLTRNHKLSFLVEEMV
jgi:hypothetical protein